MRVGRPSLDRTAGRPGWFVMYKLPGAPRPNPNYSFRWLTIVVVSGSLLPKLSGQTSLSHHRFVRVIENPRRTEVLGHPGVVYTSGSPGGELGIEWVARDVVISVTTCTACAVPLKVLWRVASGLRA